MGPHHSLLPWTGLLARIADYRCDFTHTWFVAVLAALVAPPLVVYLRRRHWRFSLRSLLLAMAVTVVVLRCAAAEWHHLLLSGEHDFGDISVDGGGPWWYVAAALGFSTLYTWSFCRSANNNDD